MKTWNDIKDLPFNFDNHDIETLVWEKIEAAVKKDYPTISQNASDNAAYNAQESSKQDHVITFEDYFYSSMACFGGEFEAQQNGDGQ